MEKQLSSRNLIEKDNEDLPFYSSKIQIHKSFLFLGTFTQNDKCRIAKQKVHETKRNILSRGKTRFKENFLLGNEGSESLAF